MTAVALSGKRLPSGSPVVQCAMNISEGRRPEVIAALQSAAAKHGTVVVADCSSDPDHNRTVLTLLGPPAEVVRAVMNVASDAVRRIDLRRHEGVHPRMGVVDVVPFTPIRSVAMEECVQTALTTASRLASELGIPVYLYEEAARPGRPSSLPAIRKAVSASGHGLPRLDGLPPDMKAPLSPDRGAAVVGARGPLVAYNVYLQAGGVEVAQHAARMIRSQRRTIAALKGVRALGLFLPSQGVAQISLNVTRPLQTPLPAIYRWVCRIIQDAGGKAGPGEVIGLVPARAMSDARPGGPGLERMQPAQVLEYWLETS